MPYLLPILWQSISEFLAQLGATIGGLNSRPDSTGNGKQLGIRYSLPLTMPSRQPLPQSLTLLQEQIYAATVTSPPWRRLYLKWQVLFALVGLLAAISLAIRLSSSTIYEILVNYTMRCTWQQLVKSC